MSDTMQAVRLHEVGERPRVDTVPVPEPAAGEVRVAVRACGICGSDVHVVHGVTPTGPLPQILGHEGAGVVDAVGVGVTRFAVGDRVVLSAGYGCGACPACLSQHESRCTSAVGPGIFTDGYQAGFAVVPERAVVALPDTLDFAVGAILTDAVLTPFHAIRQTPLRHGDSAAVFGLGGLGLHAVAILDQVLGVHVIGVDVNEAALERAKAFGAAAVVNGGGKPARELRAMTGDGVDATFEFVGSAAVTDQAVKALRPGGNCVVVGLTPEPLQLLPQALLVERELHIQGSLGGSMPELAALVGLVADGTLDLSGTITHRFPIERFDDALHVLETKEGDPIRVVVEQAG
ncbi:MAG: zinc-binding dehydrogenase [Mycobacteriales bacterium]|nr:zinc-binding dehydrogenase [Frankia sp.]